MKSKLEQIEESRCCSNCRCLGMQVSGEKRVYVCYEGINPEETVNLSEECYGKVDYRPRRFVCGNWDKMGE